MVADNCEAWPCVFQQRLPTLDYDMAMYTDTAAPDPDYLTSIVTCEQIPTEANGYQGVNKQGVCDEEASAKLDESTITLDEEARATLIRDALELLSDDNFMLPLFQFPTPTFYRTDRLGGAVEADLGTDRAFRNLAAWRTSTATGRSSWAPTSSPGA